MDLLVEKKKRKKEEHRLPKRSGKVNYKIVGRVSRGAREFNESMKWNDME